MFDFSPVSEDFQKVMIKEIVEENVYEKFFGIPKDGIVVDIGANVGLFTYSITPDKVKHVYCIEPEGECFNVLKKNLQEFNNITFINKAITHETGKSIVKGLYIKEDGRLYSNNIKKEEAETITFKAFIKENDITTIDFLKCDCEGGEYDIFTEDNREWLLNNVKKVASEFHLADVYDRRGFLIFRELFLLPEYNYKAIDLDGNDITDKLYDDDYLHMWDDTTFEKGTVNNILSFNLYLEFDLE